MRDLSKKYKKKYFCYHPFETLTITADGNAQPCPVWNMSDRFPIADLNQKEVTIDEIFNSEPLTKMRKKMTNNEVVSVCHQCHRRERIKLDSQRLRYNRQRSKGETHALKQIEINFSNQCNLACAMCNHSHSSGWYQQGKSMPESLRKDMDLNMSWPTKPYKHFSLSKKFVDSIVDRLDTLEVLMIKGGEPLYDKNCLSLLNRISEVKPGLKIKLVSNITHIPQKTLDTLSKLTNVELNVSIDGTGKIYEWIRGYSFDKIVNNYKKIINCNLDAICVNITISVYNVFNVIDTIKYFRDLSPTKFSCTFNFVWEPFMSALTLLPDTYKDEIIDEIVPELKELGCVPVEQIDSYKNYVSKKYDNLQSTLVTTMDQTQKVFRDYTNWLNTIRGIKIQEEAKHLQELYNG